MIRNTSAQGRLYLSQGEEDIYIDNCDIPQHHIDGIRFLYRQFKRNKLGVIINDPFSFGRNIQIILFLKAIRLLLTKPILILCQEGDDHDWMDRFHTWTDLYDDVIINVLNPFIKKMIFINKMTNLPYFCAREWSILVVDSGGNKSSDQILKLPFKADFKIWNTPIEMKENLDKFSEIYKWLYPEETFDRLYFTPSPDNAVDTIEKAILLESFMDDIVLRRDDLNSSFEKYQRDVVMPPPKVPAISKKNKDATGTKIKRSKTKTEDVAGSASKQDVIASVPQTVETELKRTGESSKCVVVARTCDDTEDFSIDNFERTHKQDEGNPNKEQKSQFNVIEIDASDSDSSDLKLYYETDPSPVIADTKLEEMDTLAFGNQSIISPVLSANESNKGFNITSTGDNKEKQTNI